jgi:hypothetical protein
MSRLNQQLEHSGASLVCQDTVLPPPLLQDGEEPSLYRYPAVNLNPDSFGCIQYVYIAGQTIVKAFKFNRQRIVGLRNAVNF